MMRTRRGAAVAVLVMLSALAVAPTVATAAPSQAPEGTEAAGTLTATPTTGLADGDVITVSGRGLADGREGIVEVAECRTNRRGEFACDDLQRFGLFFETGSFDLTIPASALLSLVKGPYDCRPAAGRCELQIRLFDFSGRSLRRVVPLTFNPNKPLATPPTLTITPDAGLTDHQTLSASGAGFQPDSYAFIAECPANARSIAACDADAFFTVPTDSDGAFTDFIATSITIDGGAVEADCRTSDCMFVATATDGFNERTTATAPVAFDPNAVADPPPTLTVTPSTGLVGGQTVSVHGENFTPFQRAFLAECKPRATSIYACGIYTRRSPVGEAEVGPDGSFDTTFRVRPRWFYYPRGTDRNCRLERCAIGALTVNSPFFDPGLAPSAFAPITFAPH